MLPERRAISLHSLACIAPAADTGRRPALDVNAASSGRSGQTVQNYHGLRGVPRSLCKRIVLGWAGMPAAAPPLPPERAIIATSAAPPRPLSPETLLALSATVVHAESRLVAAGVSPIMLAALCIIESGGCPAAVQYRDAVGDVGRGLWQVRCGMVPGGGARQPQVQASSAYCVQAGLAGRAGHCRTQLMQLPVVRDDCWVLICGPQTYMLWQLQAMKPALPGS